MAYNNLVNLTPSHSWNNWNVIDNNHWRETRSNFRNNVNNQCFSRYWEGVNNPHGNKSKKGLHFRIMSYNILAQILLEFHSYLYQNSSPKDLIWEDRFKRIYREIMIQNPAIICLQELQYDHVDFLDSHLKKHDYKFIYKQRTGIRVDGCAIFYKASMFDLLDHQSVEFLQPSNALLNRDNIGLMAKFKSKLIPSIPLVVCTTHLLYNPKRIDVRLAQLQVFLAEIDRFSFHKVSGSHPQHLPVIITGDFNSPPDSPVIKLLTDGIINLSRSNSKLKDIAVTNGCQHLGVYLQRNREPSLKDNEVSKLFHSEKVVNLDSDKETDKKSKFETAAHDALFTKNYIKQKLRLKSAYNFVKPDGQIEVTTHQDEWLTVDYIFYSSGNISNLELIERYRLPSKEESEIIGAIPNEQYGSDHFSLAAGFLLKPKLPRSSV